jgi:endogenous inhibitor of DNA gyrase (YacG/DUF329 family)
MDQPIEVACEVCGQPSPLVKNSYVDATGRRVEWPKATVKSDGIYFTIHCPNCGERDQRMVRPDDTD